MITRNHEAYIFLTLYYNIWFLVNNKILIYIFLNVLSEFY